MRGVLFLFLLFICPLPLKAEVLFHDAIAVKGKSIMLETETGGRFLRQGGKVVEFFINAEKIGSALSGGDGFAYKEFVPAKTGILRVTVKAGNDKDSGFILSLKKGEEIILIDVEGSLFDKNNALFFRQASPRHGSQKAVKELSRKIPVVYLKTGISDIKDIRAFLSKNGFPSAPLLKWNINLLHEINDSGIKIQAAIAGASVIGEFTRFKESSGINRTKLFSFDDVEGSKQVKDWKGIRGL